MKCMIRCAAGTGQVQEIRLVIKIRGRGLQELVNATIVSYIPCKH